MSRTIKDQPTAKYGRVAAATRDRVKVPAGGYSHADRRTKRRRARGQDERAHISASLQESYA